MDNRLFPLFLLYLVIGKQYNYSYAKSLVGHNIRYSKEKEFPFIASIKYKSTTPNPQEDHICSAVLATRKHAITAEHCMVENLNDILFVTGSNNLSKGKAYKIVAWISYNQWATKNNVHLEYSDNDISIITLEHSIKSSKIKPAILSTTNIKDLYGFEVATAGWGISNDGNVSDKMETLHIHLH
ncbi:PREDICTED: granzyme M-like [Ceratosolen solmsi marchali]|uniref:Granzyme M-like n=1 Tax=Ceratosolen solmsi marchali TaxID=326594 RepID=A0AAJ6YHH6_9HYME|nr:PREDICTED: granzyme M-like [Ceratosolen solmsi marchali]